jgi:hypothetical protein
MWLLRNKIKRFELDHIRRLQGGKRKLSDKRNIVCVCVCVCVCYCPTLHNVMWQGPWEIRIGIGLKGSGLGLIKTLSRQWPGGTEENHGKPQ